MVIDEISMVENLYFERLNELMKAARNSELAFGGVQVVVTGDFYQLPPVKPFQHCIECGRGLKQGFSNSGVAYTCSQRGQYRDEDKWAFRSKAWRECDFVHVCLRIAHRQNDHTVIRMLQKCRIGEHLTPEEVDTLMNHPCQVNNATKLFRTRDDVKEVNRLAFEKLRTQSHFYWRRDTFIWRGHRQLQKHDTPSHYKNAMVTNPPESIRPLKESEMKKVHRG